MKISARDEKWMRIALSEAERAMSEGEHPIGAVIVAGDTELSRGQTSVVRKGTITAHGEILALADAGWSVFSDQRPVTVYTTLEPCLMCVGAAIQCGVDEVVFAMPAKPDGGTRHLPALAEAGVAVPVVRSHVLFDEALRLMRENLTRNPEHPGLDYAKALLEGVTPAR